MHHPGCSVRHFHCTVCNIAPPVTLASRMSRMHMEVPSCYRHAPPAASPCLQTPGSRHPLVSAPPCHPPAATSASKTATGRMPRRQLPAGAGCARPAGAPAGPAASYAATAGRAARRCAARTGSGVGVRLLVGLHFGRAGKHPMPQILDMHTPSPPALMTVSPRPCPHPAPSLPPRRASSPPPRSCSWRAPPASPTCMITLCTW